MSGIFWIIISVALGSIGQIFLKTGMNNIGKLENGATFSISFFYYLKAVFSPFVLIGLFSYGISMIMWLWVLSKYDLSFARPFASLGYIIVAFYAFFFMGENIHLIRWIGIALIILGVFFVAKS